MTQLIGQGYSAVSIHGAGELEDVVRLTCLEMKIKVSAENENGSQPVIGILGTVLTLKWPAEAGQSRLNRHPNQ